MKNQLFSAIRITVCIMGIMALLWACDDKPQKAKKPKVVRQKIAQTQTGQPAAKATEKSPVKMGTGAAPADVGAGQAEQVFAAYNPKGRIDPFVPLFRKEAAKPKPEEGRASTRLKGPLEKMDLLQFKLTAVFSLSGKERGALVEEPSGKGHVVKRGDYIGLNEGKIVEIAKDRMIVQEKFGEEGDTNHRIENKELKLLKSLEDQ
jgi:type IV pilus assembly protein PilP